jgi:hypothetical protein
MHERQRPTLSHFRFRGWMSDGGEFGVSAMQEAGRRRGLTH